VNRIAPRFSPFAILLLAFALRVTALDSIPPGWRDDEVIETTVHAQLVLDGGRPLYFVQAEGHEPLYHYLSAGWIALVGRSLLSVRLISVFFGLLAVAAAHRLTRQLFGARPALLVALLLAVSFWTLMYSRVKIRHIAELPFALLAFSHLFRAINYQRSAISHQPSAISHQPLAISPLFTAKPSFRILHCSLFISLALYTYLAALSLFIIIAAFALYLLFTTYVLHLSTRPRIWPLFLSLALAAILYLPLANAIRNNAARLNIVGGPLAALREGNPQPLIENMIGTLAMFGGAGDNEALYNIPGRPVFNLVGFYFFLGGVIIAAARWRDPRYAFLLIWLVSGLAPGFASSPPASLGHTITALPAAYILAALPVHALSGQFSAISHQPSAISPYVTRHFSLLILHCSLFIAIALHDLPDYFFRWPALSEVRYLYKADLHAMAKTLRNEPPATYVLAGVLSKWDRVAFTLEGVQTESAPRWVNAEWAIVFPSQSARFLFTPADWQIDAPPQNAITIHFDNDLIFDGWTQRGRDVIAHWRMDPAYAAAEPDMGASVASPSFPAFAFLHLLDANGNFMAGSDRFDADAFTLQPGDRFLQRHSFDAPPGTYTLEVGLYDPITGERYLADDGRDAITLATITLP